MTRTLSILALLGLTLSLAVGCPKTVDDTDAPEGDTDTDTDTDSDTDADTDTDTDTDVGTTCSDVQNFDGISEGDTVTLTNVCVTSPVANNGMGFFVQDAGGGEYSGLFVYLGSVVASVTTGDQITVTGEVTEYYDFTELTVADAGDIVTNGSCNPAATTVQAAPADFEPYESVLITVLDLNVTSDANDYGEHTTDFGGMTIDDLFWTYEGGNGDHLTSLTGLLNYSYEEYKLEPRDGSDVSM